MIKSHVGHSKSQLERRQELTEKIKTETYRLFRAQGYEKTTMRQIAFKSGILIGSLYNVFPSKEEIFKAIVIDKYNLALEVSKKMLTDDENHIMVMAFPLALSLHMSTKDERTAELLHKALSTWEITIMLLKIVTDWVSSVIHKLNIKMSEDRIKSNTLALFGCVTNFIARIRFEKRTEYHTELKSVMEMFCTLFNLPSKSINDISERMTDVLNKNDFSFFLE